MSDRPPGLVRATLTTALLATTTTTLGLQAVAAVPAALAPHTPPDALVGALAVLTATGAGLHLTVGCALLTLSAASRVLGRSATALDRLAARIAPGLLRRLVAVTVSTGLGLAATTGAATASELDLGWGATVAPSETSRADSADPAAGAVVVADLTPPGGSGTGRSAPTSPAAAAVPDPTQTAAPPPAATGPQTTESAPPTEEAPADEPTIQEVVVHEGDTLWSIAAAHLPAGADARDVAQHWPGWYAANRTVIGDDPDLIHPGQRLVPPDTR